MMHILEKWLPKASNEPEFLTTQGINFRLDTMFKDAQKSIYIVSPYIRINERLEELLLLQRNAGVAITAIYRETSDDLSIATTIFCRKNLHAKCYMTESAVLLSSMNLFEFSQVNNDEMGIYIDRAQCPHLYDTVAKEVQRLCANFPLKMGTAQAQSTPHPRACIELKKGNTYTIQEMKEVFAFVDDYPGGIKRTHNGNIVLFCKNTTKYKNEERNGILYFQGQNTGGAEQKLIYGNKDLHDCYTTKKGRIFLFKESVFCGEQIICEEPFQKDNKWVFPLRQR